MSKKIGKVLLCITLLLLIIINIDIALDRSKNTSVINKRYITTEPKNIDISHNVQTAKKSAGIGVASIFTICIIGVGSFALKRK